MSLVCCCANPSCMVNGCEQARRLQTQQAPYIQPQWHGQYHFTPIPLTEEDIRRIIREELTKAKE